MTVVRKNRGEIGKNDVIKQQSLVRVYLLYSGKEIFFYQTENSQKVFCARTKTDCWRYKLSIHMYQYTHAQTHTQTAYTHTYIYIQNARPNRFTDRLAPIMSNVVTLSVVTPSVVTPSAVTECHKLCRKASCHSA